MNPHRTWVEPRRLEDFAGIEPQQALDFRIANERQPTARLSGEGNGGDADQRKRKAQKCRNKRSCGKHQGFNPIFGPATMKQSNVLSQIAATLRLPNTNRVCYTRMLCLTPTRTSNPPGAPVRLPRFL